MEYAEALEALTRQVDEASDDEGLAMALSRRAALYVASGDHEHAELDLKFASDAWFRLDRPRDHGRSEYARARVVAQADLPRAVEYFRRAAALSRVGEDTEYELKARDGIAAAKGALGDYEGSLAEYQASADRLQQLGDGLALSANLRAQAALLQLVGRPNKALAAFDAAVDAAAAHPAAALEARIERRGQVNFTVHPDREPLDALVAEAQALGLPTLAGQARLQLAAEQLREGDAATAAATAELARQQALEKVQPILYLMACITLAEARETLGDRPGVIEILLTCKQTLQEHLGRDAAAPVLKLLDAAEQRWGEQAMQEALVVYRKRAARPR